MEVTKVMKNKINIIANVLLTISLIIIIVCVASFIIGIFNSYNNGILEEKLFFGDNDIVYGKQAINEYLKQSYFCFAILSLYGIIPIIFIPIIVSILRKFKILFSKNMLKPVIIVLLICIISHIFSSLEFYEFGLVTLPYIESIVISYLIAKKIYKINYKN